MICASNFSEIPAPCAFKKYCRAFVAPIIATSEADFLSTNQPGKTKTGFTVTASPTAEVNHLLRQAALGLELSNGRVKTDGQTLPNRAPFPQYASGRLRKRQAKCGTEELAAT
ncbi:MAG TPA: hypothetical protein VED85_04860 [Burkholderiaceae bacterium]|nr:hypothetical protein [Burkholderiaceae bacterium]